MRVARTVNLDGDDLGYDVADRPEAGGRVLLKRAFNVGVDQHPVALRRVSGSDALLGLMFGAGSVWPKLDLVSIAVKFVQPKHRGPPIQQRKDLHAWL